MMRPKLLIALLLAGSGPLHAAAPAPEPLRIASWNLGSVRCTGPIAVTM